MMYNSLQECNTVQLSLTKVKVFKKKTTTKNGTLQHFATGQYFFVILKQGGTHLTQKYLQKLSLVSLLICENSHCSTKHAFTVCCGRGAWRTCSHLAVSVHVTRRFWHVLCSTFITQVTNERKPTLGVIHPCTLCDKYRNEWTLSHWLDEQNNLC